MGTVSRFFFIKSGLLFLYYHALEAVGLGMPFRFWTFLLVTPIIKFFSTHNKLQSWQDRKGFACSVGIDSLLATIYFQFCVFLPRHLFWLFVFIVAVFHVATEFVEFHIVRKSDERYKVQISKNPLDFLSIPAIALTYVWSSSVLDFDKYREGFALQWSFLWFIFLVFQADFFFGIFHVMYHKVRLLAIKHTVHHQYQREDLNSFANFYAELTDALSMAFGIFFMGNFLTACFGQSFLTIYELTTLSALTHHRYTRQHMGLFTFWEFDALDMLFKKPRLSCYHNKHHESARSNYSAFGLTPDSILLAIARFCRLIPKTVRIGSTPQFECIGPAIRQGWHSRVEEFRGPLINPTNFPKKAINNNVR